MWGREGRGEIMNSDSNECRGFNKPFLINRCKLGGCNQKGAAR